MTRTSSFDACSHSGYAELKTISIGGVWSTLSEQNFLRYQAAYDEDMSDWDAMFGYLSNESPGYPDTLNLKLSVQPQRQGDRPVLTLEPTDHPLAVEQRDGMPLERVLDIVSPFLEH